MNSTNNNNNNNQAKNESKQHKSCKNCKNLFNLDIKDDFYDPFEKDIFNFDNIENRVFKNFTNNNFELGSEKEEEKEIEPIEEKPKEIENVEPLDDEKMEEEKEEEEKEEEINTNMEEDEINTSSKKEEPKKEEPKKENKKSYNEGTYYSKVSYQTYNNIDGEPHDEKYSSQSMKQCNNGHDISETKESYKNSDGVQKTSYQRGLDGKNKRFPANFKKEQIIRYIKYLRDNCNDNDINKKYFDDFIKIINGKKVNFTNFVNSQNAVVDPKILITSGISSMKFVERQEKEWKQC